MKRVKYLFFVLLLTIIMNKNNVLAGITTIFTIQNKLVPGNGWGYQTPSKYIDSYSISNHEIRDVSISNELDVQLFKTSPTQDNTTTKYLKNGKTTILTDGNTSPIFVVAAGNFHLIIRSKWNYITDTKITKANWITTGNVSGQ